MRYFFYLSSTDWFIAKDFTQDTKMAPYYPYTIKAKNIFIFTDNYKTKKELLDNCNDDYVRDGNYEFIKDNHEICRAYQFDNPYRGFITLIFKKLKK